MTKIGVEGQRIRLFILGYVTLFLELIFIRYLAGNIWNLGYFPNLVLLAVFVGMGTGFIFHHHISDSLSKALLVVSTFLILLLIALVHFERPAVPGFSRVIGDFGGEIFYTATPRKSDQFSFAVFVLWFLFVVSIFTLISQRTAKFFRLFAPLTSYTLDIAGSICGILSFMAVSWLQLPAYSWFLIVTPFFLMLQTNWKIRFLLLPVLLTTSWLAHLDDTRLLSDPSYTGPMEVRWSPYQKVEYASESRSGTKDQIFVNGVYHQNMNTADDIRRSFYSQSYYERQSHPELPPYKSVLVIGAGSGNDVCAALIHGVEHIDAVEIDPVIAELGRKHHPAKPYDDPRVVVTINDARAFMTLTKHQYDLIVFALTDSLIKVSPMAQLRLENYIYTVDSIRRASQLLSPDGDLLFYNLYRRPWLIDKIQTMIFQATGFQPRILSKRPDGFAVLLVGKHNRGLKLPQENIEPATDDWPFPYLKEKRIPEVYRIAMTIVAAIAGLLLIIVHRWRQERNEEVRLNIKMAFLFMGIAFLLLETKSVIQFSLLFGTTWINSSLVFLGVLSLVLAANWTAAFCQNSRRIIWIVYLLLMALCFLALIYPLSNLLYLENRLFRFVAATLLTFSPVYFANLIFSLAFRDQKIAEHVFGWNLIGATIGGILEYTSMVLGYNLLAIIVAICYTVVFLLLMTAHRELNRTVQPIAFESGPRHV
jgi:hypothetical protein